MKRKNVLFLITGVAVLAALLSVAIASGSATRPTASRPTGKVRGYQHAPGQAAAVQAAQARSETRHWARRKVDRVLLRNFRLLRHAQGRRTAHTAGGPSETMVAGALSDLAALGASHGADPAQAGETTVGLAHDPVWVVPGSTGACLVNVDGPQVAASGCNSTSEVDRGMLWTLDTIPYGAGGTRAKVLVGAVPDGNASVTVSWADGGTTVVPVTNNVYCVPVGSHTGWNSLTLKDGAGAFVTASGMPKLP